MPRQKRASKSLQTSGVQVPATPTSPPWPVREDLRCRCPVCGHMPAEREWRRPGPHPLEAYLQRYGGEVARTEEERLAGVPRKHYMEYIPLGPEEAQELKALALKRLKEAAERYLPGGP